MTLAGDCGPILRNPAAGEGLDSAWVRSLCGYLAGFEEVAKTAGLSEALFRYHDDLGMTIHEYPHAAYTIGKFRKSYTPGEIAGLLAGDEPTPFDRIREIADECETHWIKTNLAPHKRVGALEKQDAQTAARQELDKTTHTLREEVGKLLLRATDDLLVPDDLRCDETFAETVYRAFRGGHISGVELFDRLATGWLPTHREGYGGKNWQYPGAAEDDAKRYNQGIRVARCAAALAEALEEQARPQPNDTLADPAFTGGLANTDLPNGLDLDSLLAEWFKLYGSLFFYTVHRDGVDEALIHRRHTGLLRFKSLAEELARRGEQLGINSTDLFRMAGTLHSVDNQGRVLGISDQAKDDVHALAKRIEARSQSDNSVPQSTHEPRTTTQGRRNGATTIESTLSRLRDRFEDGFRRQAKLIGVMVHHTSPTQGPQPDWPDAFVEGLQWIQQYRGLQSEQQQLRSREDYALVADRPFLDVSGRPITGAAGDPIPLIPGWRRTIGLYGQHGRAANHAEFLERSAETFDACCREAGSLVRNLEPGVKDIVWQDWKTSRTLPDDAGLWLSAVFELAWQDHDGAGLKATRSGWLDRDSAPIDLIAGYADGSNRATPIEELAYAVGDPPGYWFSQLDNLWQASAAAVDLLASLLQHEESAPTRTPATMAAVEQAPSPETTDELEKLNPAAAKSDDPFEVDEDLLQIRVDGTAHNVSTEAARMAKLLLEAKGEWVGMAKNNFSKASATKKNLPHAIQAMIETEKGKGYRLKPRR